MEERSIVTCGLPGSGKTTFLAALWHLVFQREHPDTKLRFDSLRNGDHSHINAIAKRWLMAQEQIHTEMASGKIVSMSLKNGNGDKVVLTFPDQSGELYQHMWESRECDPALADILRSGEGVLLFVHADRIKRPLGVAEATAQAAALGVKRQTTVTARWHPKGAPTQVQLVELLQLLRCRTLEAPAKRVAIMLSAWDKVEAEGRDPAIFLAEEMPLLDQYLCQGSDGWEFRIYGLSAQGGDYEPQLREGETLDPELLAKIEAVRKIKVASARIRLFAPLMSSDLTEPVAWLME